MGRRIWGASIVLGIGLLSSASWAQREADTVFLDATVVTMDPVKPNAQGVAILGDRLIRVGTDAQVSQHIGPGTKVIDLNSRAILPGFIDPHSHFLGFAFFSDEENWLDVSSVNVFFKPPPDDPRCPDPTDFQRCFIPVETQDDVIDRIKDAARAPGATGVTAMNYDAARLGHSSVCRGPATGPNATLGFECPNLGDGHARATLDSISSTIPIYVAGESGHVAYANTKALALLNICGTDVATAGCYQPWAYPSQQIALAQNGQLNEDLALRGDGFFVAKILREDPTAAVRSLAKGVAIYASHGYTLIQEGAASLGDAEIYLAAMLADRNFPVDVALLAYDVESPAPQDSIQIAEDATVLIAQAGKEDDIFVAAIKAFSDGGLAIYTAFQSIPYNEIFPPYTDAIFASPFYGLPDLTVNQMYHRTLDAHAAGWPILIHQIGNRGANNGIAALAAAERVAPSNLRDVVIHNPFLNRTNFTQLVALHTPTSFLMSDLYFWGLPLCQQMIGSHVIGGRFQPYPAQTARSFGLRVTLHTDSPVTPPDPLFAIWVAKTRRVQQPPWYPNASTAACPTTSAPTESLTIRQGIEAFTTNAAWQYGLQDERGSIRAGKVADLVLLSANPLDFENDPDRLKEIRVLGTVHDGFYRRNRDRIFPPIWPGGD